MKRFFAFAMVAMLAMVACETTPDTQKVSGTMTLETQTLDVSFVGGVGEIIYTLEGAKEGDKPQAECVADWITDVTVGETITFNVARNYEQESRTAFILITYGEQEEKVLVTQAKAYDPALVEFEAKALNGESEYVSKTGEGYNYFVILSENGTTGWSDLYLDTYYRLDVYSGVAPDAANLTLPEGVYVVDEYSTESNNTIAMSMSYRLEIKEDGSFDEKQIIAGVMIVEEDSIEAFLTLSTGEVHYVTYTGSLELGYLEVSAPDHYTSLTEDYIFEQTGVSQVYFYGDSEGNGLGNWSITAANSYSNMNGDYFMIDIYVDSLEYDPENVYGTYTAKATVAELQAGSFLGGAFGSWLYKIDNNFVVNGAGAPLATGTVKFEKSDSGAILTIDCADDLGYKIQGTYNCASVEFYDLRQ